MASPGTAAVARSTATAGRRIFLFLHILFQKGIVQLLLRRKSRFHGILIVLKGSKIIYLSPEPDTGPPAVIFPPVNALVAGRIIYKRFPAGNPLHAGPVNKMDGLIHVFLPLFLLKTSAAFRNSRYKTEGLADTLLSTVALAFPACQESIRIQNCFQNQEPSET